MPKEDIYTINQDDIEEEEEEEEVEEPKKRIATPYIIIIVLIVLIVILIAVIVIMVLVKRKSKTGNHGLPVNPTVDLSESTVNNETSTCNQGLPVKSINLPKNTGNSVEMPVELPVELPNKVFNDHAENIANAINETNTSNSGNSGESPVNSITNSIANPIGNNSNELLVNSPESTGGLPAIEEMLDEAKKEREELIKSQSAVTPEPDNTFTQNIGSIDESEKAKFNFEAMNNIIV